MERNTMATLEVEDDGVSFSSEITMEAEDEQIDSPISRETSSTTRKPRRAHWSEDSVSTDDDLNRRDLRDLNHGFPANDYRDEAPNQNPPPPPRSLVVKVAETVLELLPSLSIAIALHFIDSMNIELFLIGLIVFQSMYWPALAHVLYSKFIKKSNIFEPISRFSQGLWVNLFMVQVHAAILVATILLSLLAIQYLDITVALALMFLPCMVILLMEHILATKSCSTELIATLVIAYIGVILLTIPALLTSNPIVERHHYNGIAASIGSSFLIIQAAFILKYLRKRRIDDSLLLASIGLQGTIISTVVGLSAQVLHSVSPLNAGYISAVVVTISFAVFLFSTKIARSKGQGLGVYRTWADGNVVAPTNPPTTGEAQPLPVYVSVNRQRVLIFLFICLRGLGRQFLRHVFPSVFSVLGVVLIVTSFLFAMAYREWHRITTARTEASSVNKGESTSSSSAKPSGRSRPFQFIPWLFSREPILFIH